MAIPEIPVVIGGIYKHYKGQQYKVIAIATHSEDIANKLIVYEALYPNKVSKIWARPLPMFIGSVTIDGAILPRFKLLQ